MKAFASIVCLGATCLMPRIARVSHAVWRALQAYDHQTPSKPTDDARATREAAASFGINLLSALFNLSMLFYTATADGEKLSHRPVISSIRNSLPWLLFFALTYLLLSAAYANLFLKRDVFVKRLPDAAAKEHAALHLHLASKRMVHSKRVGRSITAGKVFCALAIVSAFSHYDITSTWPAEMAGLPIVVLSALSGMLFFLAVSVYPSVMSKYTSFRGLCVLPFAFVVFTALVFFVFLLVMLGVLALVDLIFKTTLVLASNERSSLININKPGKDKFVDVAQEQFSALYFTYLMPWVCILPAILLALAYRFDAAQAGYSTLSVREKKEMIGMGAEELDTYGCSPVMVKKAATRVPGKDLPTYDIAFYTLILTQVLGIALEFCLGWPFGAVFPRNEAQVTRLNAIFIPWPLVAYPLMLAAMLIRAYGKSKQAFWDLWSYHEKWVLEDGERGPSASSVSDSDTNVDADKDQDKDVEAAQEEEPFLSKE